MPVDRQPRSQRTSDARSRAASARAAALRAERRRRNLLRGGAAGGAALVIGGVVAGVVLTRHGTNAGVPVAATARSTAGTALPPWGRPADTVQRAQTAGLVVSSSEGTQVHFHAHLDVFVEGKLQPVPAGIGVGANRLSELHTHDATGELHIEAPAKRDYQLGALFTEWNVRLDSAHLGGLTVGDGEALQAYVDGKPFAGDPATIPLAPHRQIVLAYGDPALLPKPPPTYTFPQGE